LTASNPKRSKDGGETLTDGFDKSFTLHYKVNMSTAKRAVAFIELLLIFPAALFMTSLFVRELQPQQCEPARSAQRVVDWFSARPRLGLDLCLIALPFAALMLGSATVLRNWRNDAELRRATMETLAAIRTHLASLLIAGATLTAGGILAIVGMHMITD
jgi:hypothetical protein